MTVRAVVARAAVATVALVAAMVWTAAPASAERERSTGTIELRKLFPGEIRRLALRTVVPVLLPPTLPWGDVVPRLYLNGRTNESRWSISIAAAPGCRNATACSSRRSRAVAGLSCRGRRICGFRAVSARSTRRSAAARRARPPPWYFSIAARSSPGGSRNPRPAARARLLVSLLQRSTSAPGRSLDWDACNAPCPSPSARAGRSG